MMQQNNASCADLVGAVQSNMLSPIKRRGASTVELNGECYLAIEPEGRARDAARTARNPLEHSVYRGGGGAGTMPRDR